MRRNIWTLSALVMLIALIAFSPNCAIKRVEIIPEAKVIQRLENGNYEVNEAFLLEYYRMAKELKDGKR